MRTCCLVFRLIPCFPALHASFSLPLSCLLLCCGFVAALLSGCAASALCLCLILHCLALLARTLMNVHPLSRDSRLALIEWPRRSITVLDLKNTPLCPALSVSRSAPNHPHCSVPGNTLAVQPDKPYQVLTPSFWVL